MAAKIFHIILVFSVLFSTTGIMLGKHSCKKQMQAKMVMSGTDLNCKTTCGAEDGCDKDCCSSEYEYFQSGHEKLIQSIDLPVFNKPALLATVFVVLNIELPSFENKTLRYLTYRPPIVDRDIPVLFQTFLI